MANVYQLDDDLPDVAIPTDDTAYDRVISRVATRLQEKAIPMPQILVVDDDETFTRILSKIAQRENIPLTVCNSVKEVAKLPREGWKYDVGIVDYDLGDITGVQLMSYLERPIHKMPVVLVSQYRELETNYCPESIKNFVHKASGPYPILVAALEAHEAEITEKKYRKEASD